MRYMVKVRIEKVRGPDVHQDVCIKHFRVDCEREELPGETFEQFAYWCSRNGLYADDYNFDILDVQYDI